MEAWVRGIRAGRRPHHCRPHPPLRGQPAPMMERFPTIAADSMREIAAGRGAGWWPPSRTGGGGGSRRHDGVSLRAGRHAPLHPRARRPHRASVSQRRRPSSSRRSRHPWPTPLPPPPAAAATRPSPVHSTGHVLPIRADRPALAEVLLASPASASTRCGPASTSSWRRPTTSPPCRGIARRAGGGPSSGPRPGHRIGQ